MDGFLDTSAVVPLLIRERQSTRALASWAELDAAWAWSWLRVETEAALLRRKAVASVWENWRRMETGIRWLDAPPDLTATLCDFNRGLGLRAADAGHLLVFERASRAIPGLTLLTFDAELAAAAVRLGLRVIDPA